jgi:hypothetical protein
MVDVGSQKLSTKQAPILCLLLFPPFHDMAGPNLEVFKFGLYVFFPVAMMVHYGNPVWYQKHVIPVSRGSFLFL